MPRPSSLAKPSELFGEKDFYLEEFRGRSVLIALAPEAAAARMDLQPLASTVRDLVRNDTRVILWWPGFGPTVARRLRTAFARTFARPGRTARRTPLPAVRLTRDPQDEAVRADVWMMLRQEGMCILGAEGTGPGTRPLDAVALAETLDVPKLVFLDPRGGLLEPAGLSFADENVLDMLLRQGEAEWSGLGDRRELLIAVRHALKSGVEAVNLCAPERIAEELFTYVGSGTLFTQGEYFQVEPLGIDEYAQAERLIERGQREGILKVRTPEQIAELLAVGVGATIWGRRLAGFASLLTSPYAAERAGEIAGLYTITRFKGEGIGDRLVGRLLGDAEARHLAYVFACAVDERAQQFFARLGFERVSADDVPPQKWAGYDPRRRARVVVFRRRIDMTTPVG